MTAFQADGVKFYLPGPPFFNGAKVKFVQLMQLSKNNWRGEKKKKSK